MSWVLRLHDFDLYSDAHLNISNLSEEQKEKYPKSSMNGNGNANGNGTLNYTNGNILLAPPSPHSHNLKEMETVTIFNFTFSVFSLFFFIQTIESLRKENFELKLRIFFMEDNFNKLREGFNPDAAELSRQVISSNIHFFKWDLKIEHWITSFCGANEERNGKKR